MDDRKELSTKLMQNMVHNLGGKITPAMKKLQEKYLAGRMDAQTFMLTADDEIQKLAREREEQQNS
jgi:hypothetical protein